MLDHSTEIALWLPIHPCPPVGFPWCLARLLNTRVVPDEKEYLANWVFRLQDCCKDTTFGLPFSRLVQDPSNLLDGGSCQSILKACFNSKTFNIEIENNFARMQTMKRVSRGRSELSASLASKHVLSEAKLAHLRHIKYVRKHHGIDVAAKKVASISMMGT